MSTKGSHLLQSSPGAGGNRKRTNPRPKPKNKAQPRRVRRTKGQSVTGPRRRRSNAGPWFLMSEFHVNASMAPGPIGKLLLHPTMFPNTPYQSQCSNHTHRREHGWDIDIQVTTAASTGFRAAVVILADPQFVDTPLPNSMIWSAVLSNQGAMMTSTGTGMSRTRLQVPAVTTRLSNASIPAGASSIVGFSAGYLTVHLLDPPIGITGDSSVRVTVLGRVKLTVEGPMSGFLQWTTNHGGAPHPAPGPTSAWTVKPVAPNKTMPTNDHIGSAWLAGGFYLKMPTSSQSNWMEASWSGTVMVFGVYTCSHQGVDWQDNRSETFEPNYYVMWQEPGSWVCQVVGFVDYNDAKNQADGHTGMIGGGKELCLRYHNGRDPQWDQRFEGVTAGQDITFTLVYKGSRAWEYWKSNNTSNFAAGPGAVGARATLPPNYPCAPTTATPLSSSTQVQHLVDSLTRQLQDCQRVIQTLQRESQTSRPRWHPSLASLPEGSSVDPPMWEHHLTPSLPPSSSASTPAWIEWWNGLPQPPRLSRPQTANCPRLTPDLQSCLPTRSASAPPSCSMDLLSPMRPPPSEATSHPAPGDGTQAATGSNNLPREPALPECPGCNDPTCDDCFTDEEDDSTSVQLPSTIGSVESLVDALSRLGASTV